MNSNRPVIISVVQYQQQLADGTFSIFDLIDKLEALGADGIELRREMWANYATELPAVRDRFRAAGKIVTYATFSTLFAADAEAQKLLLHDLDTARALGAPLLRVFPGAAPADLDDPAWDAAREAVDYAASQGVILALENFARPPGNRLSELIHILDNLRAPALMTNIDIGNYATNGDDVVAAIRSLGDRAVYAHLKDKSGASSDETTTLGRGTLPMRSIITALNALPQEMIYCFEFGGGGEADTRIRQSLAYLHRF